MAKPCVDEEWLSPSPTLSLTARVRVRAINSALRSSTSKPALNLSRGFGLRAPVERRKRSLLGADVNPNGRPHGGPIKDRKVKQRGPCRKGHFFVILADQDHVFFEYQPKHTSAAVCEMFKGFSRYIQADAHAVYDAIFSGAGVKTLPLFADEAPPPKEVGCWAHARRYFWEAATCKYELGVDGLRQINNIFAADRLLAKLPPQRRQACRPVLVKPHVDAFFAWVHAQSAIPRERGLVNSALGYAKNQEAALRRFLEDGRLRLDNNPSERALRTIASGRKAWLFFGSDDHASAAANLFSLIAGCKLHRIDPEAYLTDVIRVMPYWPRDRYLELAPKYWAKTRASLSADELARPIGHVTVPPPAPK